MRLFCPNGTENHTGDNRHLQVLIAFKRVKYLSNFQLIRWLFCLYWSEYIQEELGGDWTIDVYWETQPAVIEGMIRYPAYRKHCANNLKTKRCILGLFSDIYIRYKKLTEGALQVRSSCYESGPFDSMYRIMIFADRKDFFAVAINPKGSLFTLVVIRIWTDYAPIVYKSFDNCATFFPQQPTNIVPVLRKLFSKA